MRRKTVLIAGAGREQALAINEAKALGLRVVACDADPQAVGFRDADTSLVLDIRDIDALTCVARQHRVDGVFAHAVEIPHVVAEVAARLHLPGLKPEVAWRATNKFMRISRLKECGIPCARFELVREARELAERARYIGYPLVLKPIDSAGARGVRVVATEAELVPAYQEAVGYSKTNEVLLEEKLSGPELSTESVVYGRAVCTFALADRNYARSAQFQPYFVEDGINYPTTLPADGQQSVLDLVERTIAALGIDFGAAKGDVIVDKGVPKIIEMAARTSGGWFGAGSIPIATGVNVLKPLLQMAVGDAPDLNALVPTRQLGCAQRYVIPTTDGVVTCVSGVEASERMPGVAMAVMFPPKIGDRIRKATNHAERYGQIICTAATREEAIRLCEQAIETIHIETRPVTI